MKHQIFKNGVSTILLIALVCTCAIAQRARPKIIKWDIPGGPPRGLTNRQVSGQSVLDLPEVNSRREAIYWFAARPYSPGQSFVDSTNAIKLAASILGRVVSMDQKGEYVENPSPCATGISSPFSVDNVERSSKYGAGYKFTIKQSKVKNLSTSANIEADIKKMIGKANVTKMLIDSLRAELTSGYSRLNNSDVKIVGTYEVYRLSDDVMTKLSRLGQGYFSDCQTYLTGRKNKGYNEGLISSIGFVIYNVEYSQNLADTLAFKINSILARNGLNVNPKFVIDNRVRTNIDASINRGYQVLVWKKVPLDAIDRG